VVSFDDVRLRKGERTLTATADAKEQVAESGEGNNALSVTARCKDDD
jgi:subtilase family serine protease